MAKPKSNLCAAAWTLYDPTYSPKYRYHWVSCLKCGKEDRSDEIALHIMKCWEIK